MTGYDDVIATKIAEQCGKEAGDIENQHIMADEIVIKLLRELGYTKTADAWEAVPKWYA